MFNLNKFIADSVTFRPVSMFAADIEANKDKLSAEIKGKKVCASCYDTRCKSISKIMYMSKEDKRCANWN